jgi:hypothetical protein
MWRRSNLVHCYLERACYFRLENLKSVSWLLYVFLSQKIPRPTTANRSCVVGSKCFMTVSLYLAYESTLACWLVECTSTLRRMLSSVQALVECSVSVWEGQGGCPALLLDQSNYTERPNPPLVEEETPLSSSDTGDTQTERRSCEPTLRQ